MFGYISIQKNSLSEADWQSYRSYYCGLCRALRQRFGTMYRLLLSYDLAFLALLLTALHEDDDSHMCGTQRCPLHPFSKTPCLSNAYIDYAADMTVLLAYHKCRDQWLDEKSLLSRAEAHLLHKSVLQLSQHYPRQAGAIEVYMREQQLAEQRNEEDLDTVANLTGQMLGELCAMQPIWREQLQEFGFRLGRFIYIMDAYEDIDKDIRHQNYNPLRKLRQQEDFEQRCAELLNGLMADCAEVFERLPVVLHSSLLRNIIYAGVWGRYEVIHRHRTQNKGQSRLQGKTGK